MSDQLQNVQRYYDKLAPRLFAVEERNWHLQSRMTLVLQSIDQYAKPNGRALDIGCGTGFLLERLAQRGFSGVGIDLSPKSIEITQERLRELGVADRLSAQVGSAYEPPEGPFDLITITDVLEHLEDPVACLTAARKVLAPGGVIVVSTPNRRSLNGARRWVAQYWKWLKTSLAPIDNWQTWGDLAAKGDQAGLTAIDQRGIFFRPGGRVGAFIGQVYALQPVRAVEVKLSRTQFGRFGFYICTTYRGK